MNRVGDTLYHVGANEELVRSLVQMRVEFVVVGGLAVSWYCPDRQADDMDLLVNPSPENSERIASALAAIQLSGYGAKSFARPGLRVQIKQVHYAELLTPRENDASFSEIAATAVDARLFNIPVRLASPAALIAMKRQAAMDAEAQRDKHLADINCLEPHAV